MSLPNPIGGYFGLETPTTEGGHFHSEAIAVNSGRNALVLLLEQAVQQGIQKVYLPYYMCDVVIQPITALGLEPVLYRLDNSMFPEIRQIEENAVLLYANYFGLTAHYVSKLQSLFPYIILDNAQAFFQKPLSEIDSFYSPRKFFGIPDGGYAYTSSTKPANLEIDSSDDRCMHLNLRNQDGAEVGYAAYKEHEKLFTTLPLKGMSSLTEQLLSGVDYDAVKATRNNNFAYLHEQLSSSNQFTTLIDAADVNGPMVYPYMVSMGEELRAVLIKHKVFVAQYWPNVKEWVGNEGGNELYWSKNLLPLPIDQRYTTEDMQTVIDIILG